MISIASLKGQRTSNEDRHNIVIEPHIQLVGIYDGHGGSFVSEYLSTVIPAYYVNTQSLTQSHVNKIHNIIQSKLESKYYKQAYTAGSTCLIVIRKQNQLEIVNLGDSRCVLCKNNIAIPLTKDHKPNWPDEYNRITGLGGTIYQDGEDYRIGALSVSRSFGDFDNAPYIEHKPDLFTHQITTQDQFLIIACDGLWDVMSNQDAVNYILINKCNAHQLAQHAIDIGSSDNVSVIVWKF